MKFVDFPKLAHGTSELPVRRIQQTCMRVGRGRYADFTLVFRPFSFGSAFDVVRRPLCSAKLRCRTSIKFTTFDGAATFFAARFAGLPFARSSIIARTSSRYLS